jgi:NAD-dependent dihydropyrimidine dehydrogenase PreA subunit
MPENTIIFCNCQSRNDTPEWAETAAILGRFNGIHLVSVTDLCGCSALDPVKLTTLIGNAGKVLVIACHPRPVTALLQRAGINGMEKIRIFDLLEQNSSGLSQILDEYRNPGQVNSSGEEFVADQSWPAWYPLIDEKRCTACGQCAEFCLFGVYRKSGDRVTVVHPQACKNNCPACARICPQVAIVFPKYVYGGAIGGSESIDEAFEMQRLQKDTDVILGQDIYQALENRKLKRRMIIREDALKQAISEQEEALRIEKTQ